MRFLLTLLLVAGSGLLYPVTARQDSARLTAQWRAWLDQCWNYRFNQPDSAKYYGNKVLKEARDKGYPLYEAEALHNIGIVFEAQGDYEQALEMGLQTLALRQQLNDSAAIANTWNNIGIIYDQMGNYPRALDYYYKAYRYYQAKGDQEKLAMVSVNLGIVFKAQGEYTKVVDYYREAYTVYKALQFPAEAAFCEANLGSVFYYTRQYDSCLFYSLLAEKAFLAQNNLQSLPIAQANAGMAYFELGRPVEARQQLAKALVGHRNYNNKKEIAFVLIQLGKVHMAQKERGEAIRVLTEALSLATGIHSPKQVMDAARLLSEQYAGSGDYKNAWTVFQTYSTVKDSLFEQEKMKAITGFQAQYETEKKEQQIRLLQQEGELQALRLKQRNMLLLVLAALFITGGLAVYFIMARRRIKAEARLQAERSLQEQAAARAVLQAEDRERRRLAADLHDGVGQLLSAALLQVHRAQEQQPAGSSAAELTDKAVSLLNEGYDEMRQLSHRMMPSALLKAGLPQALREFVDRIQSRELSVELHTSGLEERLPEQTETVLYRIIQEAVNNVLKHAAASSLSIQLAKEKEGISLTVEDNGKGFDPAGLETQAGIGLKNIRSRVMLLNGTLEMDAAPGRGSLLAVFIPGEQAA
ncbi:MAG: sensor histidine kinase [Candidatus Pseudobacter hemicellulosilyticus]|uniref:Oxygen sensor histidine kinase NreB n=1 Tax=Candidatus Pseudobacter hemicellulosilyticus TaxID=3121375 RepID=A0AAJ6BH76_9BACT|nr:MAG: sensor histidine kinase [Pseudobacter sp.]